MIVVVRASLQGFAVNFRVCRVAVLFQGLAKSANMAAWPSHHVRKDDEDWQVRHHGGQICQGERP